MVSRTEGNIDDFHIGGYASAEIPKGKAAERIVITGVDIVLNYHLQETNFTKEVYKKYIKDDIKSIKGQLEEQRPERVKPFMIGATEQIKHILANFKNYQFFIDKNMNPDGRVAVLDYREHGVTSYMIFFRGGLGMEYGKTVGSYFGSVICRHNWLAAAFHPHSTRAWTNGTDVISSSSLVLNGDLFGAKALFLRKHVMYIV